MTLQMRFLNNSLENWLMAVAIMFGVMLLGRVVQRLFSGWLAEISKKTKNDLDDFLVSMISEVRWEWLGLGLYGATRYLEFNRTIDQAVLWAVVIIFLNRAIRVLSALIDYVANKTYLCKENVGDATKGAATHILLIIKIGVAGVIGMIALDNLGFNIGALVAGLGVTGIIVGLALQNIVGDLFSSLCIILDKPFEVGDFIIVGDYMGVVARIGIKTTRVTSLGGEQLVFANSDLTGSRIRNYKRMARRRVVFGFGVLYSTPETLLRLIPDMVKKIIVDIEDATFDRAHFQKFGDSSLDFEVVYYVESSDYNKYMDIQQQINFQIFSVLGDTGVSFAFPTRTIHIEKSV